jgi:hypothetical protein
MEQIHIESKVNTDSGWLFTVVIGAGDNLTKHTVELQKEYYEKLTRGEILPEELINRSFEFLLEREPKESILREFNLQLITKYFPEYEKEIKLI